MKKAVILMFLLLGTLIAKSQYESTTEWPEESFSVVHSVDFEDNTPGMYSANYTEWEDDWNSTYDSEKHHLRDTWIIQKGSTKCMEINFPEGSWSGGNEGGEPQGIDFTTPIPGMDADSVELYLSYDVMWKPGFDFVISGKTPGYMFVGEDWSSGENKHSGGPHFHEGGRFMLSWIDQSNLMGEGHANLGFYFYHHDWDEDMGQTRKWESPFEVSDSFIFYASVEKWYNITIRMVLNTCNEGWDTPDSTEGNKDGFAEGFINGRYMTRWDNLRMRNVETIGINSLNVYSQFGGSSQMFATTRDEWVLADNYYIWTYDPSVTSVPRYYERSDPDRVLHIPQSWTNATFDAPVITAIPPQTIYEGETFSTINLDDYVYDFDHNDDELSWEYYGNSNIDVNITDRIATLDYNDWIGSEDITFIATDPDSKADRAKITFAVTKIGQRILINCDYDNLEATPPDTISGNCWNHLGGGSGNDVGTIHDLYNTDSIDSSFDLKITSGSREMQSYINGYKGTDYPDTCEYTLWRMDGTGNYSTMDISGFKVGEDYRLKIYSSQVSGEHGNTLLKFRGDERTFNSYNNTDIVEWTWLADAVTESLRFEAEGDYGFMNIIEINTRPNPPSDLVFYNILPDSISFSWTDNSSNETSSIIERSSDLGSGFVVIDTVEANVINYTDTGLVSGNYYYRIRAKNTVDYSDYSDTLSVNSLVQIVAHSEMSGPGENEMFFMQVADHALSMHVVLTCTTSDYDVYGKRGSEPTKNSFDWRAWEVGDEDYLYNNPETGTWYIMVHSFNGNGAYELTCAIEYETIPVAPSNLVGTSTTSSSAGLSWSDNSNNETYFIIERSNTSGSEFVAIDSVSTNETSYTDTGLESATNYYYKIRAKNAMGYSEYTDELEVRTECSCINETFTDISGTISDNSGPMEYDNDMDCEKLIQVDGAISITLTFTAFDVESGYDIVTVYDGDNASAAQLGEYSGTSLPPALTSSGGSMLVVFTTDYSVTMQGWEAEYTSSDEYQGPCIDETFTALTGSLSDNSGPEQYTNYMECHKLIQPEGATSITLTFTAFDVESGYDFVTVYDGDNTSATQLGRYSGTSLPPELTSSGGSMLVVFTTDYSVTMQGWEAEYTSSDEYQGPCIDETFTDNSGIISDNSGPDNYVNYLDCEKLIQTTSAGPIELTFTSFNTEANYDFVYVYDGATASAPLLGTYSGTSLPPMLSSSGGSMLVVFTTDYSVTMQGWEAEYVISGSGESLAKESNTTVKDLSSSGVPDKEEHVASIHPNPTQGELIVTLNDIVTDAMMYEVVNSNGSTVLLNTLIVTDGISTIDMSALEEGLYILRLYNDEFLQTFKVVILQ